MMESINTSSSSLSQMDHENKKKGVPQTKVKYLADIIGEWGRWQFILCCFIFIFDILSAINNMGYTFHNFSVDYWCEDVPEDFQFDLVCDRSYLASLSQSLYMSGYIVAGTLLAYLSDKYGRKPLAIFSFITELGASLSCALSANIIQYLISRTLVGMAKTGRGIALSGLVIECLGPKRRADIIIIIGFGWVFGYCSLPGIAIWLRSFRLMQLFGTSILAVIFVIFLFFLNESPRWQIVNGYYDQAENTIRNALKMNGKSDENLKEDMQQLKEHIEYELKQDMDLKQRKTNVLDLLRSPNLRKCTLIFCFCFPVGSLMYYGISYNIGSFGGNYFISFILGGLIEAPSQILCLIVFRYMGRREVSIIFFAITCLSCLAMIINNPTSRVISALICKLALSTAKYGFWFISLEIYPTVARNTGRGFISVVTRIGAITGPFVHDISQVTGLTFVFCFYAALTGICTLLTFYLPETRGKEIPDTFNEAENLAMRTGKREIEISQSKL